MAVFTVKFRTTSTQFAFTKSAPCLLDFLETHSIEVAYQCRIGYCGICRLKLLKGKVTYFQQPLALINNGEILPCCCTPITNIELEM